VLSSGCDVPANAPLASLDAFYAAVKGGEASQALLPLRPVFFGEVADPLILHGGQVFLPVVVGLPPDLRWVWTKPEQQANVSFVAGRTVRVARKVKPRQIYRMDSRNGSGQHGRTELSKNNINNDEVKRWRAAT
jgi:hypothetical protein